MQGVFGDDDVSRKRKALESMRAPKLEAKILLDAFLVFFLSKLQKQFLGTLPHFIREDLVLRECLPGAFNSLFCFVCWALWHHLGFWRVKEQQTCAGCGKSGSDLVPTKLLGLLWRAGVPTEGSVCFFLCCL